MGLEDGINAVFPSLSSLILWSEAQDVKISQLGHAINLSIFSLFTLRYLCRAFLTWATQYATNSEFHAMLDF